MTDVVDLNLQRAGAALMVLGVAWAIPLFFVVGVKAALASLGVASFGLLVIAALPNADADTGDVDA